MLIIDAAPPQTIEVTWRLKSVEMAKPKTRSWSPTFLLLGVVGSLALLALLAWWFGIGVEGIK